MNEEEFGLSFDGMAAAHENYIIIFRTKFIHKETGQEYTYDEFRKLVEFDATGMTPEEESREYTRLCDQYQTVYDKEHTICDMNTLEELGKIEIPDGLNTIYFDGDTLIVFDGNFGTFQTIDFSKLGTNEFQWVTAEKIN